MARAGLDTELVVGAASALADAEGLPAVTLARLAGELGVKSPSLYVHVSGLADLRRRVAIRAMRELTEALRNAAAGRAGGDALRAFAAVYRSYARAHPGTYQAIQSAGAIEDPDAAAAAADLVDVLLAVLRGYALAGDDAIHAARIVRAALHGFVSLESGDGFQIPLGLDDTFARLISVLDGGLRA